MTFDDIEIDSRNFEIRRAGVPIPVEPKVFDLIHFLSSNPNQLVTRDDLIDAVWDGRIVSDAALSTAIKMARKALGDYDVATSRIKTVRGRGFRMELPAAEVIAPFQPQVQPALQPVFSVLMPGGHISAGSAAEVQRRVSHVMARVPFVRVFPPAMVVHAPSLEQGFAFEINGRQAGNQSLFDCLLFDVETSATIWTYETQPFDPANGHDAVLNEIATRLEPQLVRAIVQMLAPSEDARAIALRGLGTMKLKGWNAPAFDEAEAILCSAIEKDETLAFAHAGLSLVRALGQQAGLTDPDEMRRQSAIEHAERAIELDGMSTIVLGLAGCALCDAGQAVRGRSILERAMSIDNGHPQVMAALGSQLLRDNEAERAVDLLRRAIETAPQDSTLAVWGSVLALALLQLGDLEAAKFEAQRAVRADDRTHLSRITLAAVHAIRNESNHAAQALDDALRVTPNLTQHQVAALVGDRLAQSLCRLNARLA